MKMKKTFHLFVSVGLLLCYYLGSGSSYAQNYPTSFVIISDQQYVIPVHQIDRITFNGGRLSLLTSGGQTETVYPKPVGLSMINKCFFSNQLEPTGREVVLPLLSPRFFVYLNGDMLHIGGLHGDSSYLIQIVSMSGRLILQRTVNGSNNKINTSDWADGFYVLLIDNQAIKFVK